MQHPDAQSYRNPQTDLPEVGLFPVGKYTQLCCSFPKGECFSSPRKGVSEPQSSEHNDVQPCDTWMIKSNEMHYLNIEISMTRCLVTGLLSPRNFLVSLYHGLRPESTARQCDQLLSIPSFTADPPPSTLYHKTCSNELVKFLLLVF